MRTVIITLVSLGFLYLISIPRPFSLREGNIDVIADKGATLSVSYDYSDSEIYDLNGTSQSMSEYLSCQDREWILHFPDELKEAENAFKNTFNTFSKTATIVSDELDAKYQMQIKVDKFCYGKVGGGLTADSKGWATGSVSVRDTTTGETIAVFDFNKVNACPTGKDSRNPSKHRTRGYQIIAGYLARSFNNAK